MANMGSGDIVERRLMKQWMLRITAYAQRLLDDLEDLDWPEGVRNQRQWIGRSEGAQLCFGVADSEHQLRSTPPVQIRYLARRTVCLLLNTRLFQKITTEAQQHEVLPYVDAKNRSDLERKVASEKEKQECLQGPMQ